MGPQKTAIAFATPQIFVPWDGFEMIRVHARWVAAQVVEVEVVRDRMSAQQVGIAMCVKGMGVRVARSASDESIPIRTAVARPEPAWRPLPDGAILVYFGPESFDWLSWNLGACFGAIQAFIVNAGGNGTS
jgi:hypothetical protein